jgi:taurine dioxygenase
MHVRPLSPALAAEIVGADLARPMPDDDFARVKRALLDHCVLVFRDQHLSPERQIAFSRGFGELHIHLLDRYLMKGHPEILMLTNLKENDRPVGIGDAGRYWHSDVSYEAEPPLGSLLYGVEIPPVGGDTFFANMYAAYDALDEAGKRRVAGLRARHRYKMARYRELIEETDRASAEGDARLQAVSHPIARRHPETGRKALYVNRGFTVGIEGPPGPEAEALLAELLDHVEDPRFQYRHVWRPRDLVFWDNRCVMHLATPYDPAHTRLMWRTTVKGDRPV